MLFIQRGVGFISISIVIQFELESTNVSSSVKPTGIKLNPQ